MRLGLGAVKTFGTVWAWTTRRLEVDAKSIAREVFATDVSKNQNSMGMAAASENVPDLDFDPASSQQLQLNDVGNTDYSLQLPPEDSVESWVWTMASIISQNLGKSIYLDIRKGFAIRRMNVDSTREFGCQRWYPF